MSKDLVMRGMEAEIAEGGAEAEAGKAGKKHSYAIAEVAARTISDRKGEDVTVLDISRQSSFADYFVNATATNQRMLRSMVEELTEKLEKSGYAIKGQEGRPESGWVLTDAGDVIINIFSRDEREKYQIERIWSDAEHVDMEGITD